MLKLKIGLSNSISIFCSADFETDVWQDACFSVCVTVKQRTDSNYFTPCPRGTLWLGADVCKNCKLLVHCCVAWRDVLLNSNSCTCLPSVPVDLPHCFTSCSLCPLAHQLCILQNPTTQPPSCSYFHLFSKLSALKCEKFSWSWFCLTSLKTNSANEGQMGTNAMFCNSPGTPSPRFIEQHYLSDLSESFKNLYHSVQAASEVQYNFSGTYLFLTTFRFRS